MTAGILHLEERGPLFQTYFEKKRDQKGDMKHAVEMMALPITFESENPPP